nr:amidohydrolase family protein [Brevibacterium casei]
MTLDRALEGYTRQGAWAWHEEQNLGVITVGAKADLVAWSADLYSLDAAGILEQRADLTIVGGAIVHDAMAPLSSDFRVEVAAKTRSQAASCSGHQHH